MKILDINMIIFVISKVTSIKSVAAMDKCEVEGKTQDNNS